MRQKACWQGRSSGSHSHETQIAHSGASRSLLSVLGIVPQQLTAVKYAGHVLTCKVAFALCPPLCAFGMTAHSCCPPSLPGPKLRGSYARMPSSNSHFELAASIRGILASDSVLDHPQQMSAVTLVAHDHVHLCRRADGACGRPSVPQTLCTPYYEMDQQ
eukprot:2612638-Pleurochrysis_carterae.AAC.1